MKRFLIVVLLVLGGLLRTEAEADGGLSVAVGTGYNVVAEHQLFWANIQTHERDEDERYTNDFSVWYLHSEQVTALQFDLIPKEYFMPKSRFSPFIGLGIGFYFSSEEDTRFVFNSAVGADFKSKSGVALFIQVQLTGAPNVSSSADSLLLISGVRFAF